MSCALCWSLLASSTLAGPLLVEAVEPEVVPEKVASVYLPDCFTEAMKDKREMHTIQEAVEAADRDAKERGAMVDEARATANLQKTEISNLKARVAKLEYETFRKETQNQLKKLEQQMNNHWLHRVQAAVKTVAERDGYSIVLYERHRRVEKAQEEVELGLQSLIHAVPVAAYVSDESRVDITDDVLEVMQTAAEESKDDATAVPAAAE